MVFQHFPLLFPPCYIGIYCADARADARPDVRGSRVSTPAINLLNENPSLVALGKLTHTNPRATHEPTNPQTSPAQPSHPHPPPSARTHEPMNKSSPAQPITIPGQPRSPKSLCITSHDGLHVLYTAKAQSAEPLAAACTP